MKKITALAIAFCLAAVTIVPGMQTGVTYAGEQQEASLEGDYAKDEILVVFEEDVNKKEAQEVVDQQDGKELTVLNTPQEEVTGLVELPKKQDVEEAVAEYQKDPDVAYAQPNYKYKLAESSANTASTTASLNDSYRGGPLASEYNSGKGSLGSAEEKELAKVESRGAGYRCGLESSGFAGKSFKKSV